MDKDPEWRATAVFTREEVEPLLLDTRLPEDRRLLYAFLFLTGMRIGEAVALRWNAWNASARPLGRLRVSRALHRKQRREKSVKTERPARCRSTRTRQRPPGVAPAGMGAQAGAIAHGRRPRRALPA